MGYFSRIMVIKTIILTMKLHITGKNGKMGKALLELIEKDPFFSLDEAAPDAIVDFSAPAALPQTLKWHKPCVIGTTGLSGDDQNLMREAAKHIPVLYSPNFSFGIALMKKLIRTAAPFLSGVDLDLIEAHHAEKKDLPSGTALSLGSLLNQNIKTHSIRAGGIIGEHSLLISWPFESLKITHRANSRHLFAKGALMCAKYIFKKEPNFYSFDDLLEEVLLCPK